MSKKSSLWVPYGYRTWQSYTLDRIPNTLDPDFVMHTQLLDVLCEGSVYLINILNPSHFCKEHLPEEDKGRIHPGAKAVIKKIVVGTNGENYDPYWKQFYMEIHNTIKMSKYPGFPTYYGHIINPESRVGYLVTKYIPGLTLEQSLSDNGMVNNIPDYVRWSKDVIIRLLELLSQCHENGIIHRDVKTDNIMLPDPLDGKSIVLIDFGLSSWDGLPWHPASDLSIGTSHYIPREAYHPEDEITHHRDLYATGIILYELYQVSHFTPHQDSDENDGETIEARIIANEQHFPNPILRKVPRALSFFIACCCQEDKHEIPTANELLQHPFLHYPRDSKGQRFSGSFLELVQQAS